MLEIVDGGASILLSTDSLALTYGVMAIVAAYMPVFLLQDLLTPAGGQSMIPAQDLSMVLSTFGGVQV